MLKLCKLPCRENYVSLFHPISIIIAHVLWTFHEVHVVIDFKNIYAIYFVASINNVMIKIEIYEKIILKLMSVGYKLWHDLDYFACEVDEFPIQLNLTILAKLSSLIVRVASIILNLFNSHFANYCSQASYWIFYFSFLRLLMLFVAWYWFKYIMFSLCCKYNIKRRKKRFQKNRMLL